MWDASLWRASQNLFKGKERCVLSTKIHELASTASLTVTPSVHTLDPSRAWLTDNKRVCAVKAAIAVVHTTALLAVFFLSDTSLRTSSSDTVAMSVATC